VAYNALFGPEKSVIGPFLEVSLALFDFFEQDVKLRTEIRRMYSGGDSDTVHLV
jgi:hypothetical protein